MLEVKKQVDQYGQKVLLPKKQQPRGETMGADRQNERPEISRSALISAGANFVSTAPPGGEVKSWSFSVFNDRTFAIAVPEVNPGMVPNWRRPVGNQEFLCKGSLWDLRFQMANFVQKVNEDDARALLLPWRGGMVPGWPDAHQAVQDGHNVNALLFSAAEKGDERAARMYLEAGADPLAYTREGECAAHRGIEMGMVEVFSRPEWLMATPRGQGENGLFTLAENQETAKILRAIELGADGNARDRDGKCLVDRVKSLTERDQISAAIANAAAKGLHEKLMDRREKMKSGGDGPPAPLGKPGP